MIVCHCRGVTDHAIRNAVREGARTRRDIAQACAAAAHCGGCGPAIDAILASEIEATPSATFSVFTELAPST